MVTGMARQRQRNGAKLGMRVKIEIGMETGKSAVDSVSVMLMRGDVVVVRTASSLENVGLADKNRNSPS
jgi:hypothetical protein